MLNEWHTMVSANRKAASLLADSNPEMMAAVGAVHQAQGANGTLDAKTRELIALAVAVTTRCDGCIGSHALAARKAGATEAEVGEALGVAIALNTGAAFTYSLRALDAFAAFDK